MNRIDTINARENMFGIGKSGFHDNADLPGQDATYVSPEWFNTVQEELCNLLELRGITLDPASKRQLYDLLTTQADLEALADEIETNFIRKSQIVDNLTTNDADKVASAKQVKILQDNKLDKSSLNNTLTSTSTTQALTAAQGNILNKRTRKAFANIRGTGTPVLLSSDNFASIIKNGTGDYTLTFIEPMPDNDYAVFFGWSDYLGGDGSMKILSSSGPSTPLLKTTTQFRFGIGSTTAFDAYDISVLVFR